MEAVNRCMDSLLTAIEQSSVYADFQKYKEQVEQDQEMKERINEYRRRNYILQNNPSGQMDLFQELDNLEKEYRDFLKEEMVQKYLESEIAVCRLVQQVSQGIAKAVDLDVEQLHL